MQRNHADYRFEVEIRASCAFACQPIYLEGPLSFAIADCAKDWYARLTACLWKLLEAWNDTNDGPAFIPGLA